MTDEVRTDPTAHRDPSLERQARRLAMVSNLTSNGVMITDAAERIEWATLHEVPPTIVVEAAPGAAPTPGGETPVASTARVVRSSPETLNDALHALKRATSGAGGDHG